MDSKGLSREVLLNSTDVGGRQGGVDSDFGEYFGTGVGICLENSAKVIQRDDASLTCPIDEMLEHGILESKFLGRLVDEKAYGKRVVCPDLLVELVLLVDVIISGKGLFIVVRPSGRRRGG